MKYILIPIFYLIGAIIWFVMGWLGSVIYFIFTLSFEKPEFRLKYWYSGNQTLTDVEFDSPWEWYWLTIKTVFQREGRYSNNFLKKVHKILAFSKNK